MKATLLTLAFLVPAAARADEKTAVHFNQDVRPILSNRCFKCHGPDLKKGGLDLQTFATATKKLDDGEPAFVPGDARQERTDSGASRRPNERMPPKGDPLTPEQIAKLKAWIDQGAKYEEHWAYVKPVQQPLPGGQEQGLAAQRHRRLRPGPAGAGRPGAVAGGGQARRCCAASAST